MTRTTIRADAGGDVTLTYYDDFQDRTVTRHFFVRGDKTLSRYVREWRDDGTASQVCADLSSVGPTLLLPPGDQLVDLIRREWKRARAAERREEQRMRWG